MVYGNVHAHAALQLILCTCRPVVPVKVLIELKGASGDAGQVNVNQNEHLMVWMRPAAQPSFRKLWAVIGVAIPAGGAACTLQTTPLFPPIKAITCWAFFTAGFACHAPVQQN